MPTINPTLPNDGEDIDAVDISGPVLAILGVINGNIDQDNLALGSMTWAIMSAAISNAIPTDAMVDAGNLRISRDETMADHVASGLVLTADAPGSTLLYSMSSGVVYINGRRLTVAADANRTATASRDTYIYVTDNLDGTASVARTAVTNNNASPAMPSNSILIGIIVSGAGNIAGTGSINQGEPDRVLPIVSSIPYQISDSVGNIICNREASPAALGQRTPAAITLTTTEQTIGSIVINVTKARLLKITAQSYSHTGSGAGDDATVYRIKEGSTLLDDRRTRTYQTVDNPGINLTTRVYASVGSHTYLFTGQNDTRSSVLNGPVINVDA